MASTNPNPMFVKLPPSDLRAVYREEPVISLWGKPIGGTILFQGKWRADQVELVMEDEPYQLPDRLARLEEPFIHHLRQTLPHKRFEDGGTVRLLDVHQEGDHLRFHVQPATYYQYLLTNWAAAENYAVQYRNGPPVPFRDLIEPGPALQPLASAVAANHIGISCILVCDGHALLTVRSPQLITGGGMLSVSAGGVLANDGARTDLHRHMLTEIEEELGIGHGLFPADNLYLNGIAREHWRAGKPEAHFVLDMPGPFEHISEIIAAEQGVDAWESAGRVWVELHPAKLQALEQIYHVHPSTRIAFRLLMNSRLSLFV